MAQSDPSAFEYIARLKHASKLRYTTVHDAELLLGENYFKNSAASYLAAGDEIDVVCFGDDGSWTKGLLEVVSTDRMNTRVQLIGSWRSGGDFTSREMTAHFIPSSADKNKAWIVRSSDGDIVARDLTKEEAKKMAPSKPKRKAA